MMYRPITKTHQQNESVRPKWIDDFFKPANELTDDEFSEVLYALDSTETRKRFRQERIYGKRPFIQENLDAMEVLGAGHVHKPKTQSAQILALPSGLQELLEKMKPEPSSKDIQEAVASYILNIWANNHFLDKL